MLTYHILTFGCQMNFNDSERITRIAENLKFKKVTDRFKADLVIVNTCGIRQSAEDRVIGIVPKLRKKRPNCIIIITGCSAHRKDFQKKLVSATSYFIEILKLPQFLKELAESKIKIVKQEQEKASSPANPADFFKISPLYSSPLSAYVPIMTGCNNFCSYCVVPYARGREFSRPSKDIMQEVKQLVTNGYKEIILLGQNVNSYQPEPSKNEKIVSFPALLEKISNISGDFWIRFLTSHPKDMSDDLIELIARSNKITNYIHLPFQSGSNRILKLMKRKYTIEHYLQLITKIRTKIPQAALSTDIIVGFPGETKEDFGKTAQIMKTVGFDMAYISAFSSRPETVADNLVDDVSEAEKKERKLILTEILEKTALKNNQSYLGKEVEVLIERQKPSLAKKHTYLGKTETYKNIRINLNANQSVKIGSFCKVKVTEAGIFGLEGTL
ncbi:MAG: tRNA (N6-isopentenyl adenosine(37)-C2)-methylthiotransferase MiaB [Patescibacteria group bacterium]|nr:tRNA (N6-isopentenyl adenosine(37)-C2)-methylthiotransferase MiaB [Patescibacteria group bacterium]